MKAKDLFKRKKPSPEKTQQRHNQDANLELLKQEFAGMEAEACHYFTSHHGRWDNRPRYWLIPGEGLDDLKPEYVDYVLKYIGWFKKQIKKDDLVYD